MAPRFSTETNPAAPGSQGVETMGKPRAGGLLFSVSSVTSCFIVPAFHRHPHEIPGNFSRRFPLYGVEAGGLSTNMKAHSMHFTGANGEGTSVSSVSSRSAER